MHREGGGGLVKEKNGRGYIIIFNTVYKLYIPRVWFSIKLQDLSCNKDLSQAPLAKL